MSRVSRLALAVVFLSLAAAAAGAQQNEEFFPGGTYDPAVPTPAAVLGYEVGTHHTDYAGLERWLAALRPSERVRVLRYGESIERRPLYLVVISSPANLARLDVVRADLSRLADPRATTSADAARIAANTPAVAWMNHANDGNESAAFESAIQTTYQLAAGTDELTRLILERLVVVVNPAHNPESHERFVNWYNSAQVGSAGTADRAAAEHNSPWGMSTNNNHYQIDLNRDAFFVTQPETAALVRAFGEWNPVVFADHHGQTKNMFFPPPAEAVNLNVTREQFDWMDKIGHAIGSAFDRRGWSYYRRGRFDLFYAGFWDSWPTLNGAVGLTFETDGGGDKGLAWEREDKTVLTLRDGVLHHHTATMATLRLTAENKEQFLTGLHRYKQSAIEEGARGEFKQVVLLRGKDHQRVAMLVNKLREQRIEVYETRRPLRLARAHDYMGGAARAREVPAGSYVVPLAQPQGRLAKAILEVEPKFKKEFLENEERKKRRADLLGERPRDGFYDVTAWSLPILYGVEAHWAEDAFSEASAERLSGPSQVGVSVESLPARPSYGYLFGPESFGSMRLLAQLMREKFNAVVATEPFGVAGRNFPRGTVLVRTERNPANLHERITKLAQESGVALVPLQSARVDGGPDFGEDPFVELLPSSIAVVTDDPTDERAYGATWFTLEQRLGLPFTALKLDQLRRADLRRYDVIVLPHGAPGDYQEMLGESGIARLRRWAEDGGTLVLIKGAAAFATREGVRWTTATLKRHKLPVRLFFDEGTQAGGSERPEQPAPGEVRAAREDSQPAPGTGPRTSTPQPQPSEATKAAAEPRTASEGRASDESAAAPVRDVELIRTSGALIRVKVDSQHFLGYGYDTDVGATVSSNYAFNISRQGKNVAAYPEEDALRLAGFVWPESRRALARTLYLWQERAGRGQVILFADDPNFRAAQLSTMRLFFNAVLLAPSFAGGR